MRVAHLLPTLEIGGRERAALDLAAAQRAIGIDAILVTHGSPGAGRATLDPGEVPVVPLGAGLRADLVHAHGHLSAIPAARLGLPSLATLHVALGSGWRWAVPAIRALRQMGRVTAVSNDLARRFSRWTRLPIETVRNGIDLSRIAVTDSVPAGALRIAMSARLHPVKRHRDAFAALSMLEAQGVRAKLLVAGDGPLEAELRARARHRPNIELLGPIQDVPALLARCDALLLCSDHEGTPLALIEALAAGRACVATRVGGIPDLARAGDGVVLVPPRNPPAIAAALRSLVDFDRRQRLGAAARAHAAAFDLEPAMRRYHAIYAEILSGRAASRPVARADPARP